MTRLITAEDLLRFRFIGDPALSSLGTRLAYTVKTIDGEKYRQHLWVGTEQFTRGPVSDAMPRWSPDGRTIAFVRTREEDCQVWLISSTGGEARPLTSLAPGKIKALEWSPDAAQLAITYHRDPHPELKKEKKQPVVRQIRRLRHKEEAIGFLDGEYDHVWVVRFGDGTAQQITFGEADDFHPAWSPDGAWIAYASNRHPDPDANPLMFDLFVVRAEGGEPRKLHKPHGPAFCPVWSPDGRRIAYLGNDDPESSWGIRNTHVWVAAANGQEPAIDVTEGFDRTCEDVTVTDTKSFHGVGQRPYWSADGKEIYFLASDSGTCHIFRWNGKIEPVTEGDREVMNFAFGGGRFAMTISDARSIGDLYTLTKGELRRETDLNGALFGELKLSSPETFDTGIQGWILKPPEFEPGSKYPLILQIHGGPRAQYGHAFFHEFQLLAAQGYVVLYSNPRGSQGYGEKFAGAIREDWGNLDYLDLTSVIDRACALPYVDAARLGVCGGSYGGYMTNWIIGHTDRFKAAITMRSVTNLTSFNGTSDIGYDDFREFGTHAFEDPERYARMSPITYVKNMKTPLLILHSENDLRCPIEQAEQLFSFLKTLNREVEFVRFPEECHDLSRTGRPDRRIERLRHIVRWWKRHLG